MPKKRLYISLATKFSITFALLIIVIMLAVAYALQKLIITEFTEAYKKNMLSDLDAAEREILDFEKNIRLHLNEFAEQAARDEEFGAYVSSLDEKRNPYVITYASQYMKAMRLDALEIIDRRGNILSSGFSPYSYGRNIAVKVYNLRISGNSGTITWFRNHTADFPAITAIDSFVTREVKYYVIGAIKVDSTLLQNINRDTTNILIADLNGTLLTSSSLHELNSAATDSNEITFPDSLSNYNSGSFDVPILDNGSFTSAKFTLLQPKETLFILIDKLQKNIFIITALGILVAIILSIWRTRTITKPIRKLAGEASSLSLDNLELTSFSNKRDEVGMLSRALHDMIHRLHQSRIELTDAEQKAARAEIARQVNHDLRNGFIPIRHILEHWEEVAENEPENLVKYFNERKINVKESLDYLQNLSKLYTRIQPEMEPEVIDVNYEIEKLVKSYRDFSGERITYKLELYNADLSIYADPVQFRRLLENIIRNAIEAIETTGQITLATDNKDGMIIICCTDSGIGIPDEIKEKLFTSNITTKKEGTGLGLANVKRIISDLNGKIKIDSKEGEGTTIRIVLPQYKTTNDTEEN